MSSHKRRRSNAATLFKGIKERNDVVHLSDEHIKDWEKEARGARRNPDFNSKILNKMKEYEGEVFEVLFGSFTASFPELVLKADDKKKLNFKFNRFHVDSPSIIGVVLHGSEILDAIISSEKIELKGCFIEKLLVKNSVQDEVIKSIRIFGCYIGKLIIDEDVKNLEITNTFVGDIEFLDTDNDKLEVFLASFVRTSLATGADEDPNFGPLTNLRVLLAKLEDSHHADAAHYVRGRLLRAEHAEARGVMRLVSWFYGAFADFGLKPGRALIWMPVFFLAVVLVGTCTGGVTVNEAVRAELASGSSSWQDWLDYSWFASGYLAVKTLLNPFSIFDSRSLVVPNIRTLIAMFVQAVMNVGLFTVIALSVRRRFKIGS